MSIDTTEVENLGEILNEVIRRLDLGLIADSETDTVALAFQPKESIYKNVQKYLESKPNIHIVSSHNYLMLKI